MFFRIRFRLRLHLCLCQHSISLSVCTCILIYLLTLVKSFIVKYMVSFHIPCYRVRYFRGRVSNIDQSEASKRCFLASDWLKFVTLPRKYRTLLLTIKILASFFLQKFSFKQLIQSLLGCTVVRVQIQCHRFSGQFELVELKYPPVLTKTVSNQQDWLD